MALVTGPLLSLDARGKVAGAIVFSNWKGRPTVRKLVTPSNPQSGAQTGQRAGMQFLSQAWAPLTAVQKALWQDLADEGQFSTFNAYVRFNLDRWVQFLDPIQDPTIAAGTIPTMGALTVTGGVRQITVSQVITTANQIWGMWIASSLTTGFTPAKSDVDNGAIYAASPIVFTLTGLAPGTYYVRTRGFTTGGASTTWVAQQSAVVT